MLDQRTVQQHTNVLAQLVKYQNCKAKRRDQDLNSDFFTWLCEFSSS